MRNLRLVFHLMLNIINFASHFHFEDFIRYTVQEHWQHSAGQVYSVISVIFRPGNVQYRLINGDFFFIYIFCIS